MRNNKQHMNISALLIIILVSMLVVALSACNLNKGNNNNPTPIFNPTSISIGGKPSNNQMEVGQSPVLLNYEVSPSNASGFSVSWSVSNGNVASISSNGLLTPISVGETVVSVSIPNTDIADSFVLSVIKPEPTINDLLSDLILNGVYNENTPEVERIPLDPDYIKLITRRESLMIGETYVETFDRGDFLDTKLYPLRASTGVTASITDQYGFSASEGRVLCFDTPSAYAGVYLAGMQFVANAKYHIEMDYNVIEASDVFYFQFRSYSSGSVSDVFSTLPSSSEGEGHFVADFTLKNYADYEIMVFCGPQGTGKLAIDNIKITRVELPQDSNCENFDTLNANLKWNTIGNAVAEKSETIMRKGEERNLKIISTGNNDGVEFELNEALYAGVNYSVSFALKATNYSGMLVINDSVKTLEAGFDDIISVVITPSQDVNILKITCATAGEFYIDSIVIVEEQPQLSEGTQSINTQNFENEGGMTYLNNNDAVLALTRINLPGGGIGNALRVESKGDYAGVLLSAKVVKGKPYKVSFNINIVENPNNSILYVQLGVGDGFKEFDPTNPVSSYNSETGYASFVVTANTTDLQIFARSAGMVFVIDNIVVEDVSLQDVNSENFDDEVSMPYSVNENAMLSLVEDESTMPSGASGKALKVISGAQYGGVSLQTTSLDSSKDYFVSFNIKVIEANGSFVYVKLGNGEAKRFDPSYTWYSTAIYDSTTGYVGYVLRPNGNNLVVFANAGGVEFVVDNISIVEYDREAQSLLEENFDKASNFGVSSNNDARLEIVDSSASSIITQNGLKVVGNENYAGIMLRLPVVLPAGTKYDISFSFDVIDDYSGVFYVQQLNKPAAFQFDRTSITNGKITGTITFDADTTTIIQIFSQGASSFIIDDIVLVEHQPEQYTITFKQDGQADIVKTVVEGESLADIPEPKEVIGHTVVWDRTDFTNITEDVVVKAIATANTYTITYNVNNENATAIAAQTVTYDTAYTLATPDAGALFVFDGWYLVDDSGNATETKLSAGNYTYTNDITVIAKWHESNHISSSDITFTDIEDEQNNIYAFASANNTVSVSHNVLTIASNDTEYYAGAWIRLPWTFKSEDRYRIVFETDATHGLYVNIEGGTDTFVSAINGRVSVVLSGVADKRCIRVFASNTANANYTISNLYIENIGSNVTTENFDTWTSNQIELSNALAVPNPYSGDNIPTVSLENGKLTVVGKEASEYYGVYIKLDTVLESGKNYKIKFDFSGEYSPYVLAVNGTEVQTTPNDGVIEVIVCGGGSNEIRIMTPSTSNVSFTIDNLVICEVE